jgi:glycosyltransferase involved in cell wall biosynthesis
MRNSLSDTGFRILLLDTKSSNPNHYICLAIQRALMNTLGVDQVVKADLFNAVSEAIKYRCNLFFAFDGEELERSICSRIAAVCGLSVLWVTEDPYELNVNVANADLFDLVFTNDSNCVMAYGEKGRHLPLAGAKPFHLLPIKERAESLRYDVFFAGTAWPNRVELLKKMLETDWGIGEIKAKIALPTNEHLPPLNLKLPISQLNWRTSPVDFARFANTSVCTLVLPRIFSLSGRDFAETPPPRLYEAALAGTVQLVHSKLAETERYFEKDQDFLYFDTAAELIKSVAALRADITWRNQIALRAQTKALAQHCYEHRVKYLLGELRSLKQPLNPIESRRMLPAGKPNVMFVVHNVVEHVIFGGVEAYLKHLSNVLAGEYEVYFYVPELHTQSKSTLIIDSQGKTLKKYEFSDPLLPWQLTCREREEAFASALTHFEISLVHFHHLIGHVPSLVEIAKALGVSTVMSFHDYYSVCHNFTLLSFKKTYCRPDEISLSQCDICLWSTHHILPGSQAARRAYWDWIIAAVDTLVFNTQGGYELTANIYPSVSEHCNVVVLPVPIMPIQVRLLEEKPGFNPLKVAILGNFLHHKGGDVIARVFPFFEHGNVEFHIFGHVESQYKWLETTNTLPFVHVHGGYKPGDLPSELYRCHVSLHLSIWPETYCMTLSEAWDCGLVPVVSDIGALGERVIDGVNGLKILPNDEDSLIQALRRLLETPGLLHGLQQNIGTAPISRTEPHVNGLRDIYKSIDFKRRLVAEKGNTLSRVSLVKLRQQGIPNWANFPAVDNRGSPPHADNQELTSPVDNTRGQPFPSHATFRNRLFGLIGRGLQHLRVYGFRSAARVTLRFIARRF